MDFHAFDLLSHYAKEYGHAKIRDAGVSDTAHQICAFLYFHSGVSQDDVAGALHLDKTTVAKALSAMQTKGLILRAQNPSNRRKNTLTITDAGRAAIADVVYVYDEWLEKVSACLTETEQRQFDDYCARMLGAAKYMCEEKPYELI